MNDEYLIQRTINTYSQTASVSDWDRAVGTYAQNGVWEIPHLSMRFDGQAAVRGALENFASGMDYVVQLNGPALIEINNDTATASTTIRECGKSKGKNEGFEFFGLYLDELIRTPDGWRFARRVFRGVGTSYYPLTSGERH